MSGPQLAQWSVTSTTTGALLLPHTACAQPGVTHSRRRHAGKNRRGQDAWQDRRRSAVSDAHLVGALDFQARAAAAELSDCKGAGRRVDGSCRAARPLGAIVAARPRSQGLLLRGRRENQASEVWECTAALCCTAVCTPLTEPKPSCATVPLARASSAAASCAAAMPANTNSAAVHSRSAGAHCRLLIFEEEGRRVCSGTGAERSPAAPPGPTMG